MVDRMLIHGRWCIAVGNPASRRRSCVPHVLATSRGLAAVRVFPLPLRAARPFRAPMSSPPCLLRCPARLLCCRHWRSCRGWSRCVRPLMSRRCTEPQRCHVCAVMHRRRLMRSPQPRQRFFAAAAVAFSPPPGSLVLRVGESVSPRCAPLPPPCCLPAVARCHLRCCPVRCSCSRRWGSWRSRPDVCRRRSTACWRTGAAEASS
jgi:hypothetical protein